MVAHTPSAAPSPRGGLLLATGPGLRLPLYGPVCIQSISNFHDFPQGQNHKNRQLSRIYFGKIIYCSAKLRI